MEIRRGPNERPTPLNPSAERKVRPTNSGRLNKTMEWEKRAGFVVAGVMMDWLRKMGCATESVVTSILGRMFFRLRCGASAVAPQPLHEVSQSRRVFPTTISLLLQTRRNSTIYVVSRGKVNHRRSSSPGRILLIIFNERDVPFSVISKLVSQLARRMLPLQSYYRSKCYSFAIRFCK
jgi:hypothetical protein